MARDAGQRRRISCRVLFAAMNQERSPIKGYVREGNLWINLYGTGGGIFLGYKRMCILK